MPPVMKTCVRCGREQYDFMFCIIRKNKDGLNNTCRTCVAGDNKKQQQRIAKTRERNNYRKKH